MSSNCETSVRRSSFVVRRSSFVVRRSSFVVRRSAFVVRRSSFVVRRSLLLAFVVVGVRRSSFVCLLSSFVVRLFVVGVGRWSLVVGWLFVVCCRSKVRSDDFGSVCYVETKLVFALFCVSCRGVVSWSRVASFCCLLVVLS